LKINIIIYFLDKPFSMLYRFTKTWFLESELSKKLLFFVPTNKKHNVLEIGCYEGLSSVYFSDTILSDSESTLTCVDPFLNVDDNDHGHLLQNKEEENFDYNISNSKNFHKITVFKVTSDEFFALNTKYFDFIYIDGCHLTEIVARDVENSFKFLEKNGIIWMDDYVYPPCKIAIDKFLEIHKNEYVIIHEGYQLAIRKICNYDNEYELELQQQT